MLVNHSHRLAFVHIPKTAGTSIRNWMKTHLGDCEEWGETHDSIAFHENSLPVNYNVFTLVRNPYTRLTSHLLFHIQGGNPAKKMWLNLRQLSNQSPSRCMLAYLDMGDVNAGSNNYARRYWFDYRRTPQAVWIASRTHKVKWFRQEEIEQPYGVMAWLRDTTGVRESLQKENVTKYKPAIAHWSDKVWTNEVLAKVNPIFEQDIKAFKYTLRHIK